MRPSAYENHPETPRPVTLRCTISSTPRANPSRRFSNFVLADARTTPLLPELEPGTVLFNRLWSFGLVTVVAGGIAFVFPQVPAIWTGFTLMVGLAWRKQPSAVQAIEERDGVRFYVERVSPFRPTRLLRTPGWRKNEPAPTDVQRTSAEV